MARKKGSAKVPKVAANRQKNIFVLRGTDEFREWLNSLAEHVGMPVTVLVEQALRDRAKKEGFSVPPRRVP